MDNVTVYEFLQEKGKVPTGPGHYNNSMEIANSIATSSASGGEYETMLAGVIDGSVENLVIPEGTTSIKGYMFSDNGSLTSVRIPGSVKTIGSGAFSRCVSLEDVTIDNGVETIMEAFNGCSSLGTITIPASVTRIAKPMRIGGATSDGAFSDCSNLTTITIHKTENSIEGAPWGATNATVVWTG